MHEIITSNRSQLAALCKEHHVQRLYIFGSALRDDFDPTRSDIDLRVIFAPIPIKGYAENYFSLRRALVDLFGRKIDLISSKIIRNPYLRKEIEDTQEIVYAA